MKDIIRLAEAIGYEVCVPIIPSDLWFVKIAGDPAIRFDPFTDANDDYAVLRWMRVKWTDQNLIDALESLPFGNHMDAYQIGDYARAALKVLDTDREGQ